MFKVRFHVVYALFVTGNIARCNERTVYLEGVCRFILQHEILLCLGVA